MQLQTVNYVEMSNFVRIFDAKYRQNYLYDLNDPNCKNLFKYLIERCIIEQESTFLEIDAEFLGPEYNHPPVVQHVFQEMYDLALNLFPNQVVVIKLRD